jgi:hypothetical protein
MVLHGKRDRENAGLRTDSATAPFATILLILLLLSLAALLNFHISSIDVYGAYLQAEPITRDIFCPPTYGLDVPKRGLENYPS